jgi:hypothetical protein
MLKEAGRIAPGDQWIEGRHHVEAIECKPHPTFATVVNITVKYLGANRLETISFYRVKGRDVIG